MYKSKGILQFGIAYTSLYDLVVTNKKLLLSSSATFPGVTMVKKFYS